MAIRIDVMWLTALLLVLTAILLVRNANASDTLIKFSHPANNLAIVGVLIDGVAHTSSPWSNVRQVSPGVYEFDGNTLFGFSTTLVVIDTDGLVSQPSNVIVYGGCQWDCNGDGIIGGPDFGCWINDIGETTSSPLEKPDLTANFGRRDCGVSSDLQFPHTFH